MSAKDILVAAKALISKPENWTQEVCARDAFGMPVASNDGAAICWCSIGAINRVEHSGKDYNHALTTLESLVPHGSIPSFNDFPDRKHEEILALFDRAIAEAE